MSNCRLPLSAVDFCVEMAQTAGSRIGQLEQGSGVQRRTLQEVIEGSVFMIVSNQIELSPGTCGVGSNGLTIQRWMYRNVD